MENVASSLAALRAKIKADNPSPRSDCNNFSPLSLLIAIYTKAERDCQIDANEGTSALIAWLAPIDLGLIAGTENRNIPDLVKGYDSEELVKLLIPFDSSSDFMPGAILVRRQQLRYRILQEAIKLCQLTF